MSQFERTALLLGEDAIKALSRKKVAIFGLGGVGSWCCEALGRAGVGQLALIDHDTVSESNLNRQLVALHSTIGQPKAAVMAARLRDINPDIKVTETIPSISIIFSTKNSSSRIAMLPSNTVNR